MGRLTVLVACCVGACGGEAQPAAEPNVPTTLVTEVQPTMPLARDVLPPPAVPVPTVAPAGVALAEHPSQPVVSLHAGQHNEMCVDASASKHGQIQLFNCHGHANQRWRFVGQSDGAIQLVGAAGSCIGSVARDNQLGLSPCDGPASRYRFDGGRLTELVTGACVTATDFQNGARVFLDGCTSSNLGQLWTVATSTALAADDAGRSARVREETAWNNARVTGCEFPVALTGCDAVRIYLAKYPTGGHVDEANKALATGQPQLEKLQKDENVWQQAGVTTCRGHTDKDACLGVELYLTKYQAGLHADEARALLNPSASAPVHP